MFKAWGISLALVLLAMSTTDTSKPEWALNATTIEACSCPMFCQCYFNPKPAAHHEHGAVAHYCQFNNAYKVNHGHYGSTNLDGAKFWITGDLGADFSQGKMDWALESGFFCVVRTRDELSIVCSEDVCPEDYMPDAALAERGWLALKLEGPFPFSMTGVLASFLQPLAEARIPIFAISTFDTDYVLVKRENLEQEVVALGAAGHEKVGEEAG